MPRSKNQKLKLLYLMDMLLAETDDEHGLSMAQIITRLSSFGISAERKAVYADLEALRNYGLDIITHSRKPTTYAIGARPFEQPELILLIDAVLSSRFLTDKKSRDLVKKLTSLTSRHLAARLNKQIYVAGRIKMQNESVFYNIDIIHQALAAQHRLSFLYYDYNFKKERVPRRDGNLYTVSPLGLAYVDDFYYLITYNEHYESITPYRIDRMRNVSIQEEPALNPPAELNFQMIDHINRVFKMFEGETVQVDLTIEKWATNSIIDRFGRNVTITPLDSEHANVHIAVAKTPAFFGWLATLGNGVHIIKPESLATEYRDYLRDIAATY